jgi:holliday junction DNA helicase RuvA
VFERLITVSGVGPKLAVTIQSGLSTERLVGAIRGQDHATLSQVPGIGKRLAERLVVDLKDKLEDLAAAPRAVDTGPAADDVLSALVNLGYQRPLAQKAIAAAVAKDKAVGENFETLFRAALAGMR